MRSVFFYVLQVIIASGILYGYYHLFLRNKRFHRYNRFYLLAAVLVSCIVPFLHIPVYFNQNGNGPSFVLQTLSVISSAGTEEAIIAADHNGTGRTWLNGETVSLLFYSLIAFILLLRILVSLSRIRKIIKNNPVEPLDNIHFVNTTEPGTPFSFFRWLFWNREIDLQSEKGEQIFRHELYHIRQRHSLDIISMELLTVFCWINPFFHLVKKELKAIHEFLADEYAIDENKKWQYAEMLLMQALNTNHHLVNPFFHNQIKRRIAMITTSQKPSYRYLRKLMVLPVVAVTIALFAFSYKSNQEKRLNKLITIVIDAGHGGEDAGAMAGDGTAEKDITLAIAKKIESLNADKNIRIILTRQTDTRNQLTSVVEITKKYQADLFISLHVNTDPKKGNEQSGFGLVISGRNKTFETANKLLANILLSQFSQDYTTDPNILQRDKGLYILDNAPCPAALVECGYLSNDRDLAYIKSPAGQEKIANAVLKSIARFSRQEKGTVETGNKTNKETEKQEVISSTVTSDAGTTAQKTGATKIVIRENPVTPGSKDAAEHLSGILVVVDGQKQTGSDASEILKKMDPSTIQSVSVLKGKTAIDKYGEWGEKGVIEIFTKSNPAKIDTLVKPAADNKLFD